MNGNIINTKGMHAIMAVIKNPTIIEIPIINPEIIFVPHSFILLSILVSHVLNQLVNHQQKVFQS